MQVGGGGGGPPPPPPPHRLIFCHYKWLQERPRGPRAIGRAHTPAAGALLHRFIAIDRP